MYPLCDDVFLKVVITPQTGQEYPKNLDQFALPFEFQIQDLTCNRWMGLKDGKEWGSKMEDRIYLLGVTM